MVDFNGSTSDTLGINTGVPQGSVLGPFLFSVYINDLPTCTDIFNMIMYADDTTLICDINGNPADEHLLNMELCKITDWLSANKLSLNVNKTKCIIFHSDKKTVHTEPLFKEHNILKVQDIYHMAILKFYSKLINDNLPNYPQFSAGQQHYNFRNPSRLLPKIKHEFPKQSLRYKLISTINETSNELLEKAKTLSQKNFMNFIKNKIVTGYSYTCELLICHVCKRT